MAVRTRRDAGILSLPGIDTSGPRELSCRYDAEELELAKAGSPYARSGTRRRGQGAAGGHEIVSDPLNHDAAVEKFVFAACGGSERLAAPAAASPSPSATSQSAPAPAPAAAASSSGGGSGEDGVSVFEAYLSKTRVAEHVAAAEALLATAREAVAGFRVEAAAAVAEAEAASSSGGGFAGMRALVEAEQRVARLEAVVGRAPTRLDRAAEGSVAEQLRVVAERLEGVAAEGAGAAAAAAAGGGGGGSAAARQHASLAAALARANELILSRKSAYAAASTSSLAARTAILYNVLQSVEGVADVLPSVVARLQQVKRITDEASSAVREPSAAADAEADASIGAAFASLQKLSASDASAALVAECAKLPDTAARMDSLADRLAALGL
eukprot:Rhum_TRINITY_DN12669_c0_g1::Rhum_TRINITY_DN12669_c0_g1_i1::g.53529::m.53529